MTFDSVVLSRRGKDLQMKVNDVIHGFTVKRVRPLKELGGSIVEMTHDRTGMEVVWLDRDEENKTFGIAFRTFPWDDTGVFHILEHSVLCGSDKYRVKEPFVELMKNSMNTFLNAMTFPDKTFYPISSRNDKDFINLTRVYLDAVFRPMIYEMPEIFRQEGWHYEMGDGKEPCYSGVVFNEMKGALADPDSLIMDEMFKRLFPDSPYRFESGGVPEKIPDLTYEDFIGAHKKFYSPSNSYVFLDGALNIDEVLGIIDDEYLSGFEKGERIPLPAMQKPVKAGEAIVEYEPGGDTLERRAIIAWSGVVGTFSDYERITAVKVLEQVLCGSNQSPLSRAVLESGLCEDISMSFVGDGIAQPFVELEIKNLDEKDKDKLWEIVRKTLTGLCENGIDRDVLSASLANIEFKMRERDYGGFPQGLFYGMTALETWLYDGDPAQKLEVGEIFTELNKKANEGYFERLIKELMLENPHSAKVLLRPSMTAGEERRKREQERLDREMSAWSEERKQELIAQQKRLDEWHNTPDSEEALKTLPRLELSDISPEPENIPTEKADVDGTALLWHDVNCNGIVYYNLYFDADGLTGEELSRAAFLCGLLGELKTSVHTEKELASLKRLLCGSVFFAVDPFEKNDDEKSCSVKLRASFSALESKRGEALELVAELLAKTLFENEAAALEVLKQQRIELRRSICESGSSYAQNRVAAQMCMHSAATEYAGGYEYYKWLCETEKNWNWEKLSSELSELMRGIIGKNTLTVSVTGGTINDAEAAAKRLSELLPDVPAKKSGQAVKPFGKRREGIAIPSDISFAATGGLLTENGGKWSGTVDVAARIIMLGYLWNVIRVQGGAYGTRFNTYRSGYAECSSYRDPTPARSLQSYLKAGEFLRDLCKEAPDLTGYIIGCVSKATPLLTPRLKGRVADGYYFRGITLDMQREMLKEIIGTTPEKLLEIADCIERTVENGGVCVIAPQNQLDKCAETQKFDLLETL